MLKSKPPKTTKICKKTDKVYGCGKELPLDQFYVGRSQCIECSKLNGKKKYITERERIKELERQVEDSSSITPLTETNLTAHDVDNIQLQLEHEKDKTESYLSQLRAKDNQIQNLEREKTELRQEINSLNTERQQFLDDCLKEESEMVTTLRKTIEELSVSNKDLTKTNKELRTRIKSMEKRIGELTIQLEDLQEK